MGHVFGSSKRVNELFVNWCTRNRYAVNLERMIPIPALVIPSPCHVSYIHTRGQNIVVAADSEHLRGDELALGFFSTWEGKTDNYHAAPSLPY